MARLAAAGRVEAPGRARAPLPQLGRTLLQRKIDPAQLQATSAASIMSDDSYLDNNMTKVEFYGAEEAKIFYSDGSTYLLGLVPELIKSPVDGVDYRTLKSSHIGVTTQDPGKVVYIPRGQEASRLLPKDQPMDFGKFIATTPSTCRSSTTRRAAASCRARSTP